MGNNCGCFDHERENAFKELEQGFTFLITEGTVNPFDKKIEGVLAKCYGRIVRLKLSESLDETNVQKYKDHPAIVICDMLHRAQERDISRRLAGLGTKLTNILVFYIASDEYSQLTLVSSEHIQEKTLHRTHGNSISGQDTDTIQKTITEFLSRVSSARFKSNFIF